MKKIPALLMSKTKRNKFLDKQEAPTAAKSKDKKLCRLVMPPNKDKSNA